MIDLLAYVTPCIVLLVIGSVLIFLGMIVSELLKELDFQLKHINGEINI